MTVRLLQGPDTRFTNMQEDELFLDYEQLLFTKVVAVADSLRETLRLLRQAEPDPKRTFFVEASRDYSVPEYIGEIL